MRIIQTISAAIIICFLHMGLVSGQTNEMPQIVKKNGRHALLVDGKPFFMFGGQSNNSSNWASRLPDVWDTIDAMHANTLEVPIYWEMIEPQPGQYDFSSLQLLLDQARQRDKRLVILWFATWKNGSNHYMPEWMKKDSKKYPNIMGKDGKEVDSPSPHTQAAMELDAKAFVEVMKYLKEKDPQHTVIMVQVQNEPGSWGSVRDYSPAAEKIFKQPVPQALLNAKTLRELNIPTNAKGNWEEVFGKDADEYFHAWSVASYIEYVAAAGKAVNPLPLMVNVALRDPLTNPPATSYESGGPTDNVIPIWKVAAPSIDLLSPDIYLRGHETVFKVIELYTRDDNPLMVPETSLANSIYLYKVIEDGIGFSPFGIDRNWTGAENYDTPLSRDFKLLAPMSQQLAQWGYEGKIRSVVEPEDHSDERVDLGNWDAVIAFGPARRGTPAPVNAEPRPVTGKAMFIKLGDDEFIAVGTNCRITFSPKGKNQGKPWQYLKVKEGYYEDGEFKMLRVLNGDETDWGGPYIGDQPKLLRITLTTR